MKLVCNVDELCAALKMTPEHLAVAAGIDRRTFSKLNAKGEAWSLKREQIEILVKLAFKAGLEGFFRLEHHPAWSTFEHAPAQIFRGIPDWDASVEAEITTFLKHKGGTPRTITGQPQESDVATALRESNCIFIGSPRNNPATEIALCLITGATPFDDSPRNREKVPIHMIGREPVEGRKSAILSASQHRHGFDVAGATAGRRFLKVHWKPREEYVKWAGEGEDAAMIVVCRSPLNTAKNVTSVFVLGYTALSTQEAMTQLLEGDCPLPAESLSNAGKPHVLAWQFRFKKPRIASLTSKADPRRAIVDSGHWASAPWT
ncbi:MAG TPA: hypothetical protein VHW00_03145 [Thermoanaerobaculia bacterium]|nr:hypothetical protein [Thermoanaerobaculia bacterium]